MALEALGLVLSALQAMKQISEDVTTNNESCVSLAEHCEILADPVNHINENRDLVDGNSQTLQKALTLLVECRNFCSKFKGRNFFNRISHVNRDKEKFILFHRRLDSIANSFTLQLTACLAMSAAQREQAAKAQRDHTSEMIMRLLKVQGKEKEFLALPSSQRTEFMNRARMMSENLRDLSELDAADFDHPPTASEKARNKGSSYNTKLSVLNSLVEEIDFNKLRNWNPANPDQSKRLGKGSFASVYKVQYGDTLVALKHFACITEAHVQPTPREIRQVRREACILQHCSSHKNVIKFIGLSIKDGIMLMELAVCSLNSVVYGRKSLFPTLPKELDVEFLTTFAFKASVINDLASALYFLHFHNIIHRDVKSCNVIMVIAPADGTKPMTLMPKLSDFGLATAVGSASKSQRSAESQVGSAPYMSPEILRFSSREPPYSPAVDMYALGILANELFTERVPWADLTWDVQIANKVCDRERPDLYIPDENEPLQRRVMSEIVGDVSCGCLAQDPNKRPTAEFLCLESPLLRQASVPNIARTPRRMAADAAAGVPDEANSFQPSQYEERRFRQAVFECCEDKVVNEKAKFFEELPVYLKEAMLNFELFANEAADSLGGIYHNNGEEDIVTLVMLPLHTEVNKYITNKLKDKIYSAAPSLLIQELDGLSDVDIKHLMIQMGTSINALHTAMLCAEEEGQIAGEEHSLRIPRLIRIMLRACALAALCEPKCVLLPTPGDRIPHIKKYYEEVFSPGHKVNGYIKEGEIVQVVRPGLYIEAPTVEATLATHPLVQPMVRRLQFLRSTRFSQSFMINPTNLSDEFTAAFTDFESGAFDVIDSLKALHYSNPTDVFVVSVMGAIYQYTARWVNEKRKNPVYASQANAFMLDIKDLEDSEIMHMLESLGPKIVELHSTMSNLAAKQMISEESSNMLLNLMRAFLKIHALASYSEPKVRLEPVPGLRVAYKANECTEVLCPGTKKKYGYIREGDLVEVVLCGVVSEDSDGPPSRPCLVRRLVAADAAVTPSNLPVSQNDVLLEFEAAFRNFDPFAFDAVDCLEIIGHDESSARNVFINRIMSPLHGIAKKYVATERATLSMQKILALDSTAIENLLDAAEPLLMQLHNRMLHEARIGNIEDHPECQRIPNLLRNMLKVHALAELSTPKCIVYPVPGTMCPYQDAHHSEILSPGSKKYGRVRENDTVEVALGGLYFQSPSDSPAIVKSFVRRIPPSSN